MTAWEILTGIGNKAKDALIGAGKFAGKATGKALPYIGKGLSTLSSSYNNNPSTSDSIAFNPQVFSGQVQTAPMGNSNLYPMLTEQGVNQGQNQGLSFYDRLVN